MTTDLHHYASGEPMGMLKGTSAEFMIIIVPACVQRYCTRSDTVKYDNLDVVKDIVTAVVLCDLSANNSDALMIGSSGNHLISCGIGKDLKTIVIFVRMTLTCWNTMSPAIDTVQKAIEVIGDALRKQLKTKRRDISCSMLRRLPKFQTGGYRHFKRSACPRKPKAKNQACQKFHPLPDYVGDVY